LETFAFIFPGFFQLSANSYLLLGSYAG